MKPEVPAAQRLCGLLGMARRAGRVTTGFDAVCTQIAQRKAHLVLLAADASPKTAKEIAFAARSGPAVRTLPLDKAAVSHALGLQKSVGVLAIGDSGFAASIKAWCPSADPLIIEEE